MGAWSMLIRHACRRQHHQRVMTDEEKKELVMTTREEKRVITTSEGRRNGTTDRFTRRRIDSCSRISGGVSTIKPEG